MLLSAMWASVASIGGGDGFPALWAAVLGVVGIALTAAATYFVSRRVNSGSIDTSAAADLWAESQSMRKELRDEAVSLRNEIDGLRKEMGDLRDREEKCREDNDRMKVDMAALQGQLTVLKRRRTPR